MPATRPEGTVSLTPEIIMGDFLRHSHAGMQALATWTFEVVPSGMPLTGPDMSLDMRLLLSPLRHRVRLGPNP